MDEGLSLTGDPGGLSRVLSNLIVNGLRHTPAGGSVEIEGRAVHNGIELENLPVAGEGCCFVVHLPQDRTADRLDDGLGDGADDRVGDTPPRS